MYFPTQTGLIAGPFDVIAIVKDTSTGRFHVYVLYESPLAGTAWKDPNELSILRLKSKMANETGKDSHEAAVAEITELRTKIVIEDDNVWTKREQVLEMDCSGGFAAVFFTRPWKGHTERPKLMQFPVEVTIS